MIDPRLEFRCSCGGVLRKIWFVEEERVKGRITGRIRDAVSHLTCDTCLTNVCVDDTFDRPWRSK